MVSFSLVPNVWKVFFPKKTEVTSNNIFMIYNKGTSKTDEFSELFRKFIRFGGAGLPLRN